ncbi:MAG: hypothetical protein RL174_501 [Actinomycetota bacterium]|jgi:hypothetical protein
MDLNHLFEDLEAQFEAAQADHIHSVSSIGQTNLGAPNLPPSGPIMVEVNLVDGLKLFLIAATIGLDFVAGVEVDNASAVAISNRSIAALRLHSVSATQSFELKITGREFTEFCGIFTEKKSPLKIHFSDPSQRVKHGWITGQFLNLFEFADRDGANPIYLPSSAISRIEAVHVHN